MQIKEYLEKYQPIIYKTFANSLKMSHLSHAYLISGQPGTPLLEVSKYLAKSILCDNPNPLACDNCITCMRVDDNNYPDLLIIDGEKKTIQKKDVSYLEEQFEKTAFEDKGKMIYILHLVENMTVEAVNSILKFLEEPSADIYAFLTTNNENLILPTIISRCQVLHLKLIDRKEIIKVAIDNGVEPCYAEILSYFYNDVDLITNIYNNKEQFSAFKNAKQCVDSLLIALNEDSKREAIYTMQSKIIPVIKNKETARVFLDLLADCFKDILALKNSQPITLVSYQEITLQLANKLNNVENYLLKILKTRNMLNSNVNISLLLDQLIISIEK